MPSMTDQNTDSSQPRETDICLPDLLALTGRCLPVIEKIEAKARETIAGAVQENGRVSPERLERNQTTAHGLAWLATYIESLRQMQQWAQTLVAQGTFGEVEQIIHQIAFSEYLAQILGGIPMSQNEILRLHHIGLSAQDQIDLMQDVDVMQLVRHGNTQAARSRLVALMREQNANITFGASGLDDELEMIREQFRRFALDRVEPFAHEWHLKDELIPEALIREMAELGVFGLTIPENYGGLGLSKASMCVVSEELSRGYIGVGSLGTRSEIAAELILCGGTEAQKQKWLPQIASADVLPTAVFTEPNTGSDLGALRTRARKTGDHYEVTGNKTWITHAARAHMMTLLARTDPQSSDYKGLSMFLAQKQPGTDEIPFPSDGITGGEIEVLGYRGMKEYELGFDAFAVSSESLLGGKEGQGFKQLMQTFESARIQTAARAIGVAQSALDVALQYAQDRQQFGKPLIAFPRVSDKLAMMAVEIMVARQLTYFSAREKDNDRRCDLEAGMAKLLAARIAWSCADNGLQIHGGNGFATEYRISRILCDARVLNIFEGAAEIQAQVIARRLLG